MDTAFSAILVSVLTLFATVMAFFRSLFRRIPVAPFVRANSKASFNCPNICGSPTTIESRLEATLKTCLIASLSV